MFPVNCRRYGSNGHKAHECKSFKDIHGNSLMSENWRKGFTQDPTKINMSHLFPVHKGETILGKPRKIKAS